MSRLDLVDELVSMVGVLYMMEHRRGEMGFPSGTTGIAFPIRWVYGA